MKWREASPTLICRDLSTDVVILVDATYPAVRRALKVFSTKWQPALVAHHLALKPASITHVITANLYEERNARIEHYLAGAREK